MSASATSVAVGCGPLPVEEAVVGGAAGKGSEVGGVALEGAAAPAGRGGRCGKRRCSERCRDHRRRRQRRHGKSSGDVCANTRVAHPGGPSPQDARTPTYPRVPPGYPAKKLLLRYQSRRPRNPRQQTPNSQRTPNANSQPPYGQHTCATHGQHTANIRSTRRSTSRGSNEKRKAGATIVVSGGDGKPAC